MVIAGRHRLEAVRKLGWRRIRATIHDDDADAVLLVEIDENLVRADLSPAERALHVAKRKELYEKLHPETKHGAVGRGGKKIARMATLSWNALPPTPPRRPASPSGQFSATLRAARSSGWPTWSEPRSNTPDELDALAGLPEQVQRDLIELAQEGRKVSAKHTARALHREARERDLADATEAASRALGTKLAGVILTDDPTKFETWSERGKDMTSAENHYPTMTVDELKALPIPAAEDCVIFSWATVPMLPQALEIMAARGFTYKSAIFWIKDRTGTGYWTLNRVEILLIGTRGKIPAPAPGTQPPQVIEAPRGRHSEKPAVFAEIIENMFPNVPKLEMFARSARPGWNAWGNEAPPLAASPPDLALPEDGSIPRFLKREPA